MINCNPETVSTDYDTSDRLYFEPLNFEDVLEIIKIDAEGNLMGINFDRSWESTMSDFMFDASRCRNIANTSGCYRFS